NFGEGAGNKSENREKQNPVMTVLDVISGCMAPVIPAIIGAGMIRVLLIVLGFRFSPESQTMQLLTVIGDCAFYFLPILVAFSAGKKFNTNPFLVAAVVGVLIHPNFIALLEGAEGGVKFLGIPVTSATYSSTLIPSILTAWAMSWIEKLVDKITPSVTKNFLKPALILLISAPVAFVILGPLGSLIGNGLATVMLWVQTNMNVVAAIIMAAAMPFIIMTGMHWAFIPMVFAALDTPAGEFLMLPAMLISNLAQGSSCLAVALKSKNSGLKQNASASGISALVAGVTEPALYGISMPLKRPLAAVCIASGITGAFAGIMHLSAFSFATPSLVSFPQFIGAEGNNLILAIITGAIAIILSFVLTWILGFQDPVDESDGTAQDNSNADHMPKAKKDSIAAPLSGDMVPLNKVNDETFSTEVLGKGAAILPTVGKVFAPFDGEVVTIFPTKHALGLKSDGGVELLIHVGLETVSLEGKHFVSHVKDGQKIKKGDFLLEFDIKAIKDAGYEIVTPIVISNSDDFSDVDIAFKDKVTAMERIMEVE
ncbi:MAG: glucose PTS transporter subunit IIA, partial [Lachnospiraceae bacterium]|nr:glucose PTS transporter subunit IIA [Lachnospiraceae bacterium]